MWANPPQYATTDPLGVAISAIGDAAAGLMAARRQKRQQSFSDAVALAQAREAGIEPETRPAPRDTTERFQQDVEPGIRNSVRRLAAQPLYVDLPTSATGPGTRSVNIGGTGAPPADLEPEYVRLGDTGYRLNLSQTPEARAEAARQARIRQMADYLERAGLSRTDAMVAATYPESTPELLREGAAERARGRLTTAVEATPEIPAGRRAVLSERPDLLEHELYPAKGQRTAEEELALFQAESNVTEGREGRIARLRAALDQRTAQGKPMTLPEAIRSVNDTYFDPAKGRYTMDESHRMALARKLVRGTATDADFAVPAADAPPAETPKPSVGERISQAARAAGPYLGTRGGPAGGPPRRATPQEDAALRLSRGAALYAKYAGLSEQVRDSLFQRYGFTPQEIQQIKRTARGTSE